MSYDHNAARKPAGVCIAVTTCRQNNLDDGLTGFGVEVWRGFVADQVARPGHPGPGQGDPLLHSSRELTREGSGALC